MLSSIKTIDQAIRAFTKLESKLLSILEAQQKDLDVTKKRLEAEKLRKDRLESEIKRSATVLKNIQTLKGE